MKTTSLYDEVIRLIGATQNIDDATKASMIAEIQKDGISPSLQQKLVTIFQAEVENLGKEIDSAQNTLAGVIQVKANDESVIAPILANVTGEFAESSERLASETDSACLKEEKSIETAVGDALKKRDDSAADDVRKSLKL